MAFHLELCNKRIYVAGHNGMVGKAVCRALEPYTSTSACQPTLLTRTSHELDLRKQYDVDDFFEMNRPDIVIFAAARVGGIAANSADNGGFLSDNVQMATNVIDAAWRRETKRFVFLGSSCIYPKVSPQPIPESALLSGPLEETNEGYSLAKIVGVKLVQYRRRQGINGRPPHMVSHSLMPCNLYGPFDNYHPENSHVLAAMIHRFHEAKTNGLPQVQIWGTGTPKREFLYVDDLAAAILHAAALRDPPDLMNVGSGEEVSILGLAGMVAKVVGYDGIISTDPSRPDGVMQKLVSSALFRSTETDDLQSWRPRIKLEEGLAQAYASYRLEHGFGMLRT